MTKKIHLGFTLTELLIVVTILAILVVIALSLVQGNRDKAVDAKIKGDLNRLKIALEDYYGDHNCYPPPEYFDDANDCGSSQLKPYLNAISCNPATGIPYAYVTDDTGCVWYKLYGNVKVNANALFSPITIDSNAYNYGVSSNNISMNIAPLPEGHNYYYCSAVGNCTSFNEETHVCTPYFVDNPNCNGTASPCANEFVGSCISL